MSTAQARGWSMVRKSPELEGAAVSPSTELGPEMMAEAFKLWADIANVGLGIRIERWEERGLTTGQLSLMVAVRDATRGLALNELAKILHVSPTNITGITDRLVRRGLIARVPDPDDRRVIRVALTQEGAVVLGDLSVPGRAFLTETLNRMGERDVRRLMKYLRMYAKAGLEVTLAQERHAPDGG